MANRAVFLFSVLFFSIVILLSPSTVDASSYEVDFHSYLPTTTSFSDCRTSTGSNGECLNLIEEVQEEDLEMDSESSRRMLYWRRRYISYGALLRDRIPCARRGVSYYNCHQHGPVNPYRRGCSAITRCRS